MEYYKQEFAGEVIFAVAYDECKNGNKKAIIISTLYGKAKKTTMQNEGIWKKINIGDIPYKLRLKINNAI